MATGRVAAGMMKVVQVAKAGADFALAEREIP
jgi:hypothetical protein